jgi:tetratricopeptide (TPR) repeat protein
VKAGDAFVANSHALTLSDDKAYGDALWHGIDLYDQAGDLQRVIAALETFVNERPDDTIAPDAQLRLGRAYQAAGLYDKAIAAFQRVPFRYPNSLAASKSAIPLAEAYIARGPDDYPKAERVLLSVVEDNDLVDPSAEEFHQSLLELSQLYYRTQRYELAIARLEEMVERYPQDQALPRLTYLMADSYRKSALLLDEPSTQPSQAEQAADVVGAKHERLTKAHELFQKAIDLYAVQHPSTDLDKLYQKLATFYLADCVFDLGNYADSIKLYEQAAFRYQDDPAAISAYVQIVNAYCALGKPDEARTANERAKWILRRMSPDAFQSGDYTMPKKYWDDWLKWNNDAKVF